MGRPPLPLSATCCYDGRFYVRLSGAETAVESARAPCSAARRWPDAAAFWASVRDQRHPFFADGSQARGSRRCGGCRCAAPRLHSDFAAGEQLIEWGGALRWLGAAPEPTRERCARGRERSGGHATCSAARARRAVFQPLPPPLLALHQRLKAAFDPRGHPQPRPHVPGAVDMETKLADFIRDTPDGREADAILRACVHCGFCTATCPTYQLLGDELDGPRGRIYLIKQVLEGDDGHRARRSCTSTAA